MDGACVRHLFPWIKVPIYSAYPTGQLMAWRRKEPTAKALNWLSRFKMALSQEEYMQNIKITSKVQQLDIPVFTRGQLWPSGIVIACVCLCVCMCVCVRQSSVCPDDNLSPAQDTITKIGPEVQNILVKIPIVFGVHWPWPSRPNWTQKS